MRFIVDIQIVIRERERCTQQRDRLRTTIQNIEAIMRRLTTVSWLSPSSRLLQTKFQALLLVIQRALRIVEQYIADLDRVIEEVRRAGRMTESRVEVLRTDDVFNG